jgi:hypothetical protein
MKVQSIIPETRNSRGVLLAGTAKFSDGKEWRWIKVHGDGSYCFVIDSGIPSQWGQTNYGRTVAYPKRVAALKEKLAELGELVANPKST